MVTKVTMVSASRIDFSEGLLYVSQGLNGLSVFNLANPALPRLSGSILTPGTASGVVVSGERIYVNDRYGGLLVLKQTIQEINDAYNVYLPAVLQLLP